MNIKGGRRAVVGAVSKVWFEKLEGRILLSAASGFIDTLTPAPIITTEPVFVAPTINPPAPVPVPLPAPLANAPDTLYISHNPLYAVAGTPLSVDGQYLTVEILKADGTVDTSYSGTITVDSDNGNVTGILSLAANNGVATFTDLIFSSASSGLSVSDSNGDTPINNFGFAILPAGSQPDSTAAQLVITQQPVIDPATGTFSVTAAVIDRQGNPVANGTLVNLQLYSGPTGAILTSATGANQISINGAMVGPGNGAYAEVDANGYATFTGLAVNVSGTYVLALGDASPISFVLSDAFQAPAYAGSSANQAQGKFAAASAPAAGAADLSAFSKTDLVSRVLSPDSVVGDVLSILNSPFSGANGNPLLA